MGGISRLHLAARARKSLAWILWGFGLGCALGLYLLLETTQGIPAFIANSIGPLLDRICGSVSGGERGPGGLLFAFLFVILFWGAGGGLVGFVAALLMAGKEEEGWGRKSERAMNFSVGYGRGNTNQGGTQGTAPRHEHQGDCRSGRYEPELRCQIP